jgi:hypothetical protein
MLTDAFLRTVRRRRNLTCIGCSCPRCPAIGNANDPSPTHQQFALQPPNPSPHFASAPSSRHHSGNMSPSAYEFASQFSSYDRLQEEEYAPPMTSPPSFPLGASTAKKGVSAHPHLTPSGRAFARGGKVQNISSDPLSPCIIYWPNNEPFPERGQIRPSGPLGVPVSIV